MYCVTFPWLSSVGGGVVQVSSLECIQTLGTRPSIWPRIRHTTPTSVREVWPPSAVLQLPNFLPTPSALLARREQSLDCATLHHSVTHNHTQHDTHRSLPSWPTQLSRLFRCLSSQHVVLGKLVMAWWQSTVGGCCQLVHLF